MPLERVAGGLWNCESCGRVWTPGEIIQRDHEADLKRELRRMVIKAKPENGE